MGGWNTVKQYDDMYILDYPTLTWTKPETACGPESWGPARWNFSAISIFAVPYWKVFLFGGNTGELDTDRPQGTYQNDIQVLECTPEDPEWSRPETVGTLPKARADSEIIYYGDTGKLVLFGGWANRWYGDCFTCKVDDVVGPPYNVNKIESFEWSNPIGPVTGESKMTIFGEGFTSAGSSNATVRFACQKVSLRSQAMSFRTPRLCLRRQTLRSMDRWMLRPGKTTERKYPPSGN